MSRRMNVSIVLLLAALIFVTGCATTNPDGSPRWATDVPSHWRTYYAVGYGKLSNVQNSRMRAEAMAADAVARWAGVTVQGALTNYFQDSGSSGAQNLEMMESVSRQVVDISLRGIEVEKVHTAADGGVWVLVSFPVKNLKDAYKAQSEKLERESAVAEAQVLIEYLEKELAKEGK